MRSNTEHPILCASNGADVENLPEKREVAREEYGLLGLSRLVIFSVIS